MTAHVILYIIEDDIFYEGWTFGRWALDGHLADRASGASFVRSDKIFDTHLEVEEYVDENFDDEAWTYDIVKVLRVFDYEEIDNT